MLVPAVRKEVFAPHLGRNIVLGGRRRLLVPRRALRMARYRVAPSIVVPSSVDYSPKALAALNLIYKNDSLGCCVISCGYHAVGTWTGNASGGSPYVASDSVIIADYGVIGGYNPSDPSTDQGCDIGSALSHWSTVGFADGSKLAGYLAVDPTNVQEVQQCLYLFENVICGVELPDAWINPFPSGSGFVWDAGNPDVSNGHCFTGDTKVSLLDGRELSFTELAAGAAGESFGVYSCDQNGNVVAGHAHSVRKTRENAELVKVTLDNGEQIRCTPDHLFMLRDGTYCEAAKLKVDTSLMPLYRRENEAGYEEFSNPRNSRWWTTHRVVAFGVGGYTGGKVAHHYDFNKRNNSPDNLKVMTKQAHRQLHEETSAILQTYSQSEEGRAKSRGNMAALWANPEWRAKMTAKLRASASARGRANIAAGGGFNGMDPERLRSITSAIGRSQIPRLTSAENLEKAADGIRAKYENDSDFRAKMRDVSIKNLEKVKGLPLTEKQQQARRENVVIAHAARMQKYRQEAVAPHNHKVVSVEPAGREDVYDLTVDEHHNFALSAGVFVHNCFLGYGFDSTGIKIDSWGLFGTLTYAAVAKDCAANADGDLYVAISQDQLAKASQKDPNGLDWASLVADFDAIGGTVPMPAAPAPPPAPVGPPSLVTLAQTQAWAAAGINNGLYIQTRDQAIAAANAGLQANWPTTP